ncbi:MAG TPA: hypothetical protein VF158_08105 [Longimicrobiales bacterium]
MVTAQQDSIHGDSAAVLGRIEWAEVLARQPFPSRLVKSGRFTGFAVMSRIIAGTLPLEQWDVAPALRRRIRKRFDVGGITIPCPHRTFSRGEGQNTLTYTPARRSASPSATDDGEPAAHA